MAQGTATAAEVAGTGAEDDDEGVYDTGRIFLISGGHLAHDLYSSFMGVLIPAVQDKLGLSLAMVPGPAVAGHRAAVFWLPRG